MVDLVWRRGAQRSDNSAALIAASPASPASASPASPASASPASHTGAIELGAEWTVVPGASCGLRIGYLLVGPAGIFVVDTSTRPGKRVWADETVIWVNGRATRLRDECGAAAVAASARLSATTGKPVVVAPVVVVPSPASLEFGGDPTRRIPVVTAENFSRWLLAADRELSTEAVAYFTMVVEERDTWLSGVTAA